MKTIDAVTVLELNKINKNFRIYSTDIAEKIVAEGKTFYGELNMPSDPRGVIDLCNVSHTVSNLRVENNRLVGDVKVLDTPMGKILQNLMEANVDVAFRPSGSGKIDTHGRVTEYQLISINMVNPDAAA